MTLGDRIKFLRKENKMTQIDLADKLGKDNTTISKWESDIYQPDANELRQLAEIFKTTTDYLTGHTNDPTPSDKQEDLPPLLQDIDPVLARRFIEAIKDSKTELFFDNILGASPEEREALIEEFLQMRKEYRKKQEK